MLSQPSPPHDQSLLVNAQSLTDTIINEWLDRWDQRWQPGIDHLRTVVEESGFSGDARALAELVRVDIDRRYAVDQILPVIEYTHAFPVLLESRDALVAIAFEDYRARRSAKLTCPASRWSWIAGIDQQTWFRQLDGESLRSSESLASRSSIVGTKDSQTNVETEPHVGRVFGDFQLVGLLGEGAFSKVYLAKQRMLGNRYVAVKVVRRALSEPHHLARLHHTGIVPLYSLHRVGEYSLLCMPYSGAATLADWLRMTTQFAHGGTAHQHRTGQSLVDTVLTTQARLNELTLADDLVTPDHAPKSVDSSQKTAGEIQEQTTSTCPQPLESLFRLKSPELAVWLACQLAAALAHAHTRRIVHGDLKPANILLRNDGQPALIDFNLSQDLRAQEEPYHIGGTLPYMAPEQMKALVGRHSLLSTASDVYSLGVVLYEILEGCLPYASPASVAECDLDAAIQARQSMPLRFKEVARRTGFCAILRKCLAFEVADRYRDGVQLLEDLEAQREHRPLKHASEPIGSRLKKFTLRHPTACSNVAISSLGLAIISLCLIFGWVGWQRWRSVAAHDALTHLIEKTQQQQVRILDAPTNSVAEVTNSWQTQLEQSLACDRDQIKRSPILARLSERDRAAELQSLFDQTLALAWLAFERSVEQDSQPILQHLHFLELMRTLEQLHQLTTPSHVCRLLSEHVKERSRDGQQSADLVPAFRQLTENLQQPSTFSSVAERIVWARLLIHSGQATVAMEHLAAVRDARVHRFLFWDTLGKAQLKLGQPILARQSFRLAIEAAPECLSSYQQGAAARLATGDYVGAEADITQAIDLSPHADSAAVCELLLQRAMVRERLQRLQEALDDTDRAASLGHVSNRVWLMRSRIVRKMGDSQRASQDLAAGLKAEPKTVGDWIARALARANSEPQAALADLEQALKMDANSVVALQNLAYLQTDFLHDEASAISTLDRIIQIQSDHEAARAGRCVLLARVEKAELALADIGYLEKKITHLQPATLYQIGCALAILSKEQPDKRALAMKYLMQALPNHGADVVASDPDLDNLRTHPTFASLLELSEAWIKP